MNINIHPLPTSTRPPERLNNPFGYVPHPLCLQAARLTEDYLQTQTDPEKFLRFLTPELRKDEIKKALKDGVEIPGAKLEETESVVIK